MSNSTWQAENNNQRGPADSISWDKEKKIEIWANETETGKPR